jgi:catechol 2,3-dioxygenase-like lactoylglutathione lyase family enzyme
MLFLHTNDLDGLAAFYRDRLGLPEKWRDEGVSIWLDAGEVTLVLHAPDAELNPGPFVAAAGGALVWLEVEAGIEERYRALAAAGVTITMPLRRAPSRSLFCVADPEGRRVGFFEPHSDLPPAMRS